MLSKVYKYLEKSESIYDFADAVVVVRLRMTRDLYEEEAQKLRNLSKLSASQQEDLQELIYDIDSLTRVINFYNGRTNVHS